MTSEWLDTYKLGRIVKGTVEQANLDTFIAEVPVFT